MTRPDNEPDHDTRADETSESDDMADADTANGEGNPTTHETDER